MGFKTDVLVVGAGPTGLALAIDLARRGVSVRIIDRSPHGFPGSRAKGIQPRSLEILENLGVIDAVLGAGSPYPRLGIHAGPVTIPKRMFAVAQPTDDIPYPNTWLMPQFSTDAILGSALKSMGVDCDRQTQLVSLIQDEDGVTATLEGPSGPETHRCRYVVGADGGASVVRQQAGIAFTGKTDGSDRMVILDCRIDGLRRDYWHVWPWFGGRFAGACPLPGGDLFQVMIRLKPGEEPDLDPAALNARFRKQTGSRRLTLTDIRWTSVFRPNIRLAAQYRQGRLLLAGDAAHVHTPMGAQGLNTGLQDAFNLGWKIGQVLAGAPDALLDSYEAERRPIAANVLGLSTLKYDALGKLDPSAITRGKDEQQLSITYRDGPLGSSSPATATARIAGDRAPDARLVDAMGHPLRLFDILRGPQFTLLSHGPDAARDLAAVAWPDTGASLKRVAIDAGPDPVADPGGADLRVTDRDGSFRSSYDVQGDMLILIRPDGYIARIAVQDRPAAMSQAVALMAPV